MESTKSTNQQPRLNLSKFCQTDLSRKLARWAPYQLSQMYVSCLGGFYYSRHPEERELIRRTIRQVFGEALPRLHLERLYRRTFAGIFAHYQEKLFLAYAPVARVKTHLEQRLRLSGTAELNRALSTQRGVIVVTGHYGAVEFLPGALSLQGYPVAIIVRPQTKELAESLTRRAAAINLTLIMPEDGNVLPAALKALREGRILVTEVDEFPMWRLSKTETVNFLGFRMPADRTLEVLQKRSGAPLVTALVRREPKRRYCLDISPIGWTSPPPMINRRCLQHLERAIVAAPEQWYQWKEFGKILAGLPQRAAPARLQEYYAPQVCEAHYAPA